MSNESAFGPTIEQKVIDSLEKVEEWLTATEQLVAEQAPLVVQEIIVAGLFDAIFGLVLCSIFGILLCLNAKLCFRNVKGEDSLKDIDWTAGGIVSLVALIGCIIGVIICVYDIIYINLCPRLYVIEQIREMI